MYFLSLICFFLFFGSFVWFRFKVVKAGLLLMWAGELVLNVNNTLSITFHDKYAVVSKYSHFAGTLGTSVGAMAFFINILQFGLLSHTCT